MVRASRKLVWIVFLNLISPPIIVSISTLLSGLYQFNDFINNIFLTWQFLLIPSAFWIGIPIFVRKRVSRVIGHLRKQEYAACAQLYHTTIFTYFILAIIYGMAAALIVFISGYGKNEILFTAAIAITYLGSANIPFYVKFIENFDKVFEEVPAGEKTFLSIKLKLRIISSLTSLSGIGVMVTSASILFWRWANYPEWGLTFESVIWRLSILAILIIIVQALPNILLARSVTSDIHTIRNQVLKIAGKDLTAKIQLTRRDELGEAANMINKMAFNFSSILKEINDNSSFLKTSSETLNEMANRFSEASSNLAANAEELAANMEEMTASIVQVSENTKESENLSMNSVNRMDEGKSSMDTTIANFVKIAEQVKIVGEISGQTNLLAINAYIEAANAGIHGKGFGVIAQEIRNLATSSGQSASHIDVLTSECLQNSEELRSKILSVVEKIQKSHTLSSGIATAIIEQQHNTLQINDSIQYLNADAQRIASSSEELATTSENAAQRSERLKKTLEQFTF